MTGMTLSAKPGERPGRVRAQLREHVGRSATRGRLVTSIGGVLLGAALFAAGLFMLVVCDAFAPLPASVRLAGVLLVLGLSLGLGGWLVFRPWLRRGRELAAAERVETAAGVRGQPVVRGVTMRQGADSDPLSSALRERAEQRAAEIARGVEPGSAYPASAIARQGRWLWLACVGWLVLAVVFPNQLLGVFSRALMPWIDHAPFSLTQLDPTWTPEQPLVGQDVTVQVEPDGVDPEQVDLVRLDEEGNAVERFEMRRDEQGGFNHTLRSVDEPITFKLEAGGRATMPFTIDPTPSEQADEELPDRQTDEPAEPPANDAGGSTAFDPEAVARRDALDQAGWDALQERVEGLIDALSDAEADAASIDPADPGAVQALADRLEDLAAAAEAIGGELAEARAALPASVSASLSNLQDALDQMAQAQAPAPPTPGGEANGSPTQQWLDQAERSIGEQRARLAQGLGEADAATDSGTTTGEAGGDAPVFNDPRAIGGYDEQGGSGGDGPLPDAVMQQVPPSYRAHVAAYFDALARPESDTGDTP